MPLKARPSGPRARPVETSPRKSARPERALETALARNAQRSPSLPDRGHAAMITTNDPQAAVVSALSAGADESRTATDAGSAGSIDKVRDILFGSQMRDVERRFARLEERLTKEATDLKDDFRKRLDALEAYARKEDEALADQLRAERSDRVDAHASLSSELKEAAKAHDKRTSALDEQMAKGHRDLRQQMLDQHQRLSDDLRSKADEVLAALAREAQQLRSDKTDRTALAALLTEMAMRLTNEFHLPIGEADRNG